MERKLKMLMYWISAKITYEIHRISWTINAGQCVEDPNWASCWVKKGWSTPDRLGKVATRRIDSDYVHRHRRYFEQAHTEIWPKPDAYFAKSINRITPKKRARHKRTKQVRRKGDAERRVLCVIAPVKVFQKNLKIGYRW